MKTTLSQWFKANQAIILNTGSLIGTWGVTSGLGFFYWWLAAQEFSPRVVGLGSAAISAMMLIGTFCLMGLGTLLITELPRQPEHVGSLISTALIVVGVVGTCAGIVFALVAPLISADLSSLSSNIGTILLFAFGVSLTSVTLVLDSALIGLLKGSTQLWRNGIFALVKLVILFLASRLLASIAGVQEITIYATWAIGNAVSLLPLAAIVIRQKKTPGRSYRPQWSLLRQMSSMALQHHLLNLILAAPMLILPIMVTVMLSAEANAWFYVAWMLANVVYVVPGALTMVLHAVNAAQQATLRHRARTTLGLSFAISVLAVIVIVVGARQLLTFFGKSYATEATWALQILTLGAFPMTIKSHYIAICRIKDRIVQALLIMIPGCILELVGAAVGAHMMGLVGLSLGWMAAMCFESICMFPVIYTTIFAKQPFGQPAIDVDPIWLMDTALLPTVSSYYAGTGPIWSIKTTRPPTSKVSTSPKSKMVKKARLEPLQPDAQHFEFEHTSAIARWSEPGSVKRVYKNSAPLENDVLENEVS